MDKPQPDSDGIHPEVLEACDKYRQGKLSRREFLNQVEKFAVGSAAIAAILESLDAQAQITADGNQRQEDGSFQTLLQKWFAVRAPSARHDILQRLAGDWNVLLRFRGGEQSWETRCTSRAELIHGGRFLMEWINGEIAAPDEQGEMRNENYSATRVLGYDNYKKAYTGMFLDNQNTCLLNFTGHSFAEDPPQRIEMFGTADEPMLDTHDVMMKYVLSFNQDIGHTWSVFVQVDSGELSLFDFEYSR